MLLNTAWETSLATGALTHMDFDAVRALSLTYSIQEGFTNRSSTDRPRIRAGNALEGPELMQQLQEAYNYMVALTLDEAELLTVYEQALALVDQHRNGEAHSATAPAGR